nr:MAG TPA: hypothetical protein [Caudoviricetes sp.]
MAAELGFEPRQYESESFLLIIQVYIILFFVQ